MRVVRERSGKERGIALWHLRAYGHFIEKCGGFVQEWLQFAHTVWEQIKSGRGVVLFGRAVLNDGRGNIKIGQPVAYHGRGFIHDRWYEGNKVLLKGNGLWNATELQRSILHSVI